LKATKKENEFWPGTNMVSSHTRKPFAKGNLKHQRKGLSYQRNPPKKENSSVDHQNKGLSYKENPLWKIPQLLSTTK